MNPSERTGRDYLPAIAGGTPTRPAERPLVFGTPSIGEDEIAEVGACLRSGWIGQGERVERFEREFANYKGGGHAIAVNSGTAAIQLALSGLGIQAGDEVIAPTITFCPSLHAIIHAGATPVLADCAPLTCNIEADAIERRITPRTKAILVVHMCGRCCDLRPILAVAKRHGLYIIEDCAHAIEASYKGQSSGLIGDVGCFSFYATKNLTTGDGGMVITRNQRLHRRMSLIARQGVTAGAWNRFVCGTTSYKVISLGYRCRMNDISASLGLAQLKKLDERWKRRELLWQAYNEGLRDLPLILPPAAEPDTRHAYHLYTPLLLLQNDSVRRADFVEAMRAENITVGIHYNPVHDQPYYRRRFGLKRDDFPNASFAGDRTISLPLTADLTEQDVADVCTALKRVLQYYSDGAPSRKRHRAKASLTVELNHQEVRGPLATVTPAL